ncbi:PAS domain S-box-containing protein [Christiangramia echinicola]|uniref:histidine kinase n=2 Tax=Christiangramia echinicola TaxID=279359 RepID=A0A1H1SHR2_9FLAO|nr:PAS domain S-box-containing protein [Christiangramia echinicola]SDS46889.1 PAS domain S-box-containing protein [Christiangramia echinicola]
MKNDNAFRNLLLDADLYAFILNKKGEMLWKNMRAEKYLESPSFDIFDKFSRDDFQIQLSLLQAVIKDWPEHSGNGRKESYTYKKDDLKWSISWNAEEETFYAMGTAIIDETSPNTGINTTKKELIAQEIVKIERLLFEGVLHKNPDLEKIFSEYLEGLERIFPNMKASILKVEDKKVWKFASGSLPKAVSNAINGHSIGPNAGSCGTAAYVRKRIIVSNIETDPLWADFKEIVRPHGLKACWSQPILNEEKKVIATFANYYTETSFPTGEALEMFDRSASLIALIFENLRKTKDLLLSNQHAESVNKATNDAIYNKNLETGNISWSQGYRSLFGYQPKDSLLTMKEWEALVYPTDLPRIYDSFQNFINDSSQHRWEAKYRFKNANNNYTVVKDQGYVIRDENGRANYMIGVLSDITLQRSVELKKELFSEFSKIFNNTNNLTSSLKKVIHVPCNYVDFEISEIWLVNSDKSRIEFAAGRNHEHSKREIPAIKNYIKGEGLPGAVWQSREILISDIENINDRSKLNYKDKLGNIQKIIGVPLIKNDEFIGVWIAGSKEDITALTLFREICPEISEQLASEISRKGLEQDLHHIFQLAPDLIATMDFDGNFKRINKAGCELLEYSEEELLQLSMLNIMHSVNRVKCNELIQEKIQIGDNFHQECKCITGSGNIIWVTWDCTISREEGLIYAVAKDISKNKELQKLFDNAGKLARIGSWELDIENHRVFWSKITREIYDAPEYYKPTMESVLRLLRKDYVPVMQKAIEDAKSKNVSWDIELPIITLNGKEIWIRSIGKPVLKNNTCIRIYGSFQDIDQRKRAEDKIIQHNELLKDIARQQSHFVRAPVSRLMGIIDLIRHGGLSLMEKEELLKDIIESADEIDTVIRDISNKTNLIENKS